MNKNRNCGVFYLLISAQCLAPFTPWVRQQPITDEYLCNNCHISKNGLKEGLIFVNWKKQTESIMTTNAR